MIVRRFAVPVLAAMLVVAACGKKQPPPPPAPTGPTPEELAQRRADSIAAARRADSIAAARREAEAKAAAAAARARAVAAARTTLQEMVHFDFDKSDIRPDAEAILQRKVAILRASPDVQLQIQGYCDERGSEEYNLALGQRRAESVRKYLEGFGLSDSRFTIISYGEERPLDPAHNEDAWAQNRRDQFVITAGANAINPPSTSGN
ncbi:MAG: peptidoglycan-associated lipoprotein Pal [Gemmatimonadetes bacterium]|nr:peptidoglycan-associated lipoprotein Pal [Gemmatimonadota bacterium]